MTDVVLVAIPPRRVTHLPTGDLGTVLGADADGYQVVRFDGSTAPVSMKDEVLAPAPPVEVLACERCRVRPATVYDTYLNRVGCDTCYPAEPPSEYDCEFVLSYIPDDLRPMHPPRPTIQVY